MNNEYRYDAFISYRHTDLDKCIASKLQKMLENYNPPKSVKPENFKNWHVFRDETELPSSSNLSEDIKKALESSEFLIVICSPSTRESHWCMEEIRYFKKLHNGSNSNIITVVTNGQPDEIFPDELCNETVAVTTEDGATVYQNRIIEPLAANVSAPSKRQCLRKLNTEFLRIAAPLLGCGFDKLYNRSQRRTVRRIIITTSIVTSCLLIFGLYSSTMIIRISDQNKLLEEKNNEIILSQAQLYLDNDNVVSAISTSLEALQSSLKNNTDYATSKKILANASKAYNTDEYFEIKKNIRLLGNVDNMVISPDADRILAVDDNAIVYLIDAISGKIIKTFPSENYSDSNTNAKIGFSSSSGFILYGDILVCINPDNGSINWENKTYTIETGELITNPKSDNICVFDKYSHIIFDVNGSVINSSGNFDTLMTTNNVYVSFGSKCYIFRTDNLSGNNELSITDTSGLCNSYPVNIHGDIVCIGEDAVNLYVNSVECNNTDAVCGFVTCINKENAEIKWMNQYESYMHFFDRYSMNYYTEFFEYTYGALHSSSENDSFNSVVFVCNDEFVAIDKESGSILSTAKLGKNVYRAGSTRNGEYIKLATNEEYSDEVYFFNNSMTYYNKTNPVPFNSEYVMSFASDEFYAYADISMPDITVVKRLKNNPRFDLLKDFHIPSFIQTCHDYSKGLFAHSGIDIDGIPHLFIYDINNKKCIINQKADFAPVYLGFCDNRKLVLVGENGMFTIYDEKQNKTDSPDFNLEFLKLAKSKSTSVKVYDCDIFKNNLICYTNIGFFELNLSGENTEIKLIYVADDTVKSDFVSNQNSEVSAFIEKKISAQADEVRIGIFDYNNTSLSYINTDDNINFESDEITSISIDDTGSKISFVSNKGYIGIYDCNTEKLMKVQTNQELLVPYTVRFCPDSKSVVVICLNGTILKFSADTGKQLGSCIPDTILEGLSASAEYIDKNTLLIRGNETSIFLDTDLMKIKTQTDSIGYYFKDLCEFTISSGNLTSDVRLFKYYSEDELIEYAQNVLEYIRNS